MKKLVAAVIAALGATSSHAVISEDVHWRNLGAPLELHSSVVVDTDGSLTIDPGVEVRFHERASLVVRGTLRVLGSHGRPVRLVPMDAAAGWGGLRVDSGEALLAHVQVDGARVGVHAQGGATTLVRSSIEGSREDSIRAEGSARIVLRDCRLGGGATGILAQGLADVTGSGVQVLHCATGVSVAAGASIDLSDSDIGLHRERAIRAEAGSSLRLSRSAVHDSPVGLETAEASGVELEADAWACNGMDIVHAGPGTVDASGNYWGGGEATLIAGDVLASEALAELPETMRHLERLDVQAGPDGVAFTWHSIAGCAEHVVLASSRPDGGFSDAPAPGEPVADGRIVHYYRLETRPWS